MAKQRDLVRELIAAGARRVQRPDQWMIGELIGLEVAPYLDRENIIALAATALEDQNHHDDAARLRSMLRRAHP